MHMYCTWNVGNGSNYRIYLNSSRGYYLFQPPASVATIQGWLLYEGGSYFIDRSHTSLLMCGNYNSVHTAQQMRVASSRFHRPYVHFTHIDMRGALTLAHNITSCGGKYAVTVRSRSFVTPT